MVALQCKDDSGTIRTLQACDLLDRHEVLFCRTQQSCF